jgi:hypothetical protein
MASNCGKKRDYHLLLTSLSQRLSKDDLKSLVFSCGDVLPRSTADSITAGTDLFRELNQRGHLGPSNYDYLRGKLELVGRNDLSSLLPDQFEILFGQASDKEKLLFGYVSSPTVPTAAVCPMNFQLTKVMSAPSVANRMFLLCLSEQLTAEELEKLAYLVFPNHCNDQLTAAKLRLGLVDLLEKGGENVISMQFVDLLSTCLDAIGRADLAQHLCSLTAPQALLSSFSASQQQLDLKISLLLHSKHQSYDFHMRALAVLERDDGYRMRLLKPMMEGVYNYYHRSTVLPLAQMLQIVLQKWNHPDDLDKFVRASLQKVFDFNQVYSARTKFVDNCSEMNYERLHELNSKCSRAYEEFDSIMNTFEWNSDVRRELRMKERCRATPFGTPADIACEYISDLCRETSRCSGLHREKQQAEKHLQILHGVFGCCCCNAVVLQWLATLLCLSTSGSTTHNATLDLSKHKAFLVSLLKEVKDDITDLYPVISLIVGNDFLQKVVPLLESQIGEFRPTENHQRMEVPIVNPYTVFFHTFLIKLLAVASLGPSCIGVYDIQMTDQLLTSHTSYASRVILLIASGMKQQVEAFQRRALAEDRLCQQLITALTTADVEP